MQFVGDIRTLSMQAFICICFWQTESQWEGFSGSSGLPFLFRDEKPEAKKGSHSKLPGWWVAGAPGVLPPVPFPAGSAAHASGSKLCSPGFSSPGLSPDREPWERANVNISQGKVSYQPSLEVCSACHWDRVDGQQPVALGSLYVPKVGQIYRENVSRPASAAL